MTEYLSLEDLIAIHRDTMQRLGSSPSPLRHQGLLESAISRPRMAAHDENADHVRQAALLAVAVSQAQAFLDGN